jgi:predicted DsbA family dithiol-disulfide isomerase
MVHWRSYELRPKGGPPLPPDYRARIEAGRPRLYAIAREQYGLEMKPGPFGFDSRPALVGAKYAEQMGVGPAYHAAVLGGYWLEAQVIDDPSVLANIAASIGLGRELFLAALQTPAYNQAVLEDIALAQAYGLNGVPALVFAEKYLVSGAQPYPVLVQVVEQIQQESAADKFLGFRSG